MEGWPAGWVGYDVGGDSQRYVSAGGRYVLYGEPEGCLRAARAIEGGVLSSAAPETDPVRAELTTRIKELEARIAELTATANVTIERADKAEAHRDAWRRSQATEGDSSRRAMIEALLERDLAREDARRGWRALDAMACGVAHMATALSELTRDDDEA